MSRVVLELPTAMRSELKEPLGRVYTDADALLADAPPPIVAVGDIVTYHLLEAGHTPAVALIDERTKRSAVSDEIRDAISGFDRRVHVANPPGTLTDDLLVTLAEAIGADGTTLVVVDGEEDLAALPAIVAAPSGASVVYGQPGEGMVRVTCDEASTERARELLAGMDGDGEGALAALGV